MRPGGNGDRFAHRIGGRGAGGGGGGRAALVEGHRTGPGLPPDAVSGDLGSIGIIRSRPRSLVVGRLRYADVERGDGGEIDDQRGFGDELTAACWGSPTLNTMLNTAHLVVPDSTPVLESVIPDGSDPVCGSQV